MLTDISNRIVDSKEWENFQSIGMVESVRIVNGETTV